MGYETAPATDMLATSCACCARPLVDATSVETGVGPECRRKHGFDSAQGLPSWDGAAAALSGIELPAAYLDAEFSLDARRAANVLVHRIACEQDSPNVLAFVNAIRALGYSDLADRITDRIAPIQILQINECTLEVRTPYSVAGIIAFRSVPGRRWDREAKCNRFPTTSRAPLFAALRKAYPGQTARGPKGLFTIPVAS